MAVPELLALDLMAHTIEKVSIWILEALEEEWRREPDILKCRIVDVVLGEVMAKHGLENDEITRAIIFMMSTSRQYLRVIERQDGKAILPSDAGLAILGTIQLQRIDEAKAEAAALKAETHRREDFRLRIYQIIIGLLALLVAFLSYKLSVSGHTSTPP